LPQVSDADRLLLSDILLSQFDRANNCNNDDPNTNGEYWLLERVVPHCSVICDVGANTGAWTEACLRVNPEIQVYAFEPNPSAADLFTERWGVNPNIHLLRVALGDENSTLEFHDYGTASGLSGFFSRELSISRASQQTINVTCRRLDDLDELVGADIDFLKIDTEGSEMRVLRGAKEILAEGRIRLIQFEYGGTWIDAREFLADAFRLLRNKGYSFGRLLPDRVQWISEFDHRKLEKFKYSNYVACSSVANMKAMGIEAAT
jgi:FkbM family methyltransferase